MAKDPGVQLGKKIAKRAVTAPGTLVTGAGAFFASVALANPLPLILWGIGAGAYVFHAVTSKKHADRILAEEQVAHRETASSQITAERDLLRGDVGQMLALEPFSNWVQSEALTNYLERYRHLVDAHDRVQQIVHDRPEFEEQAEEGIVRQLNYMLTAFLRLVRARLTFLQILTGIRPGVRRTLTPVPGARPSRMRDRLGRWSNFLSEEDERAAPQDEADVIPEPTRRPARGFVGSAIPRLEDRLEEIGKQIKELERLASREPAAAKMRQAHIEILKRRMQFLRDCGERDQRVVAQLDLFPDAFEAILDRVSAAQFSVSDIAAAIQDTVVQVEETERFVEEMRPAMDAALSELSFATATGR